ncbi:MAG: DNA replication/repair protein RecF [Pseudomonadales bacterium]|nr:DNA replication/repair protein RecF [Pseudomonadales bacterium]
MPIHTLEITNVRNLQRALLQCSLQCNLVIGPNGSGKTSLLESIIILSQGKSFRNSRKKSIISEGNPNLTVTALLHDQTSNPPLHGTRVGISKFANGKTLAKIASEKVQRISEITSLLPVCVIEPNSTEIVEGSPSLRRQVLDWGVFHVEHEFVKHWRIFSSALKQRNALLKYKSSDLSQLRYWDEQLAPAAEQITKLRRSYFKDLESHLRSSLDYFFDGEIVTVELLDGWDSETDFLESLDRNIERDKRYGFTSVGPHKADFEIKSDGNLAKDYLSRGQKKLAVYAIRLAQVVHYQQICGKNVTLLLDDLPSELDKDNCEKVCKEIKRIECQVFITSVDTSNLNNMIIDTLSPKLFHVKHGTVTA